ncbi:unnamed protein product [Notodromas monacha]|uniref:Uncharacterized protein n=1 Tax=Notodromas monacha TaxID=399045 RepID=A0A7R9G7J0_9CRUS|nr:unnamed protein product [Notodromas monacha]CAG0912275.1 unnamed protein product [Notodromas monacha]
MSLVPRGACRRWQETASSSCVERHDDVYENVDVIGWGKCDGGCLKIAPGVGCSDQSGSTVWPSQLWRQSSVGEHQFFSPLASLATLAQTYSELGTAFQRNIFLCWQKSVVCLKFI